MLQNTFPLRSNSAPKPLTATLMQEVITMHENFLKVYLLVARDGVLTFGKSKFALKYSNGKATPSGFSHFYCHRVVLSTNKIFEGFFNISGRLGQVQPLKLLLAARSSNLSSLPKSRPLAARAISILMVTSGPQCGFLSVLTNCRFSLTSNPKSFCICVL